MKISVAAIVMFLAIPVPFAFGQSQINPYGTYSNSMHIYDNAGHFRGDLNSNQFDPDSIANPYGRYGSQFSPDSINNPYGAGNPYGTGCCSIGGDDD